MEEQLCAVCFVPCTLSCAKCKNVFYCSKEHQTGHWKEHKKECHPFKIVTLPDKGRVLIATKDMPPYSIIIQEQSIINLPNDKEDDTMLGKICLSCCKVLENLESCSKCSAPVCGRHCEMAKIHANNECKVFSKSATLIGIGRMAFCKLASIIRCMLLKTQDREKYDALMTLRSNKEHFYNDETAVERFLTNSKLVHMILKEAGLHDYDQEEIATVLGIIETNGLTTTIHDKELKKQNSEHLYAITCIASHSCVNNAVPLIQNSGRVKLIAIRPIVVGQEITITYTDLSEGTLNRQKKFRACYYFTCKCPRCEDPTELGTNFSSVRCRRCPNGYLVPKYQWDIKPNLETEMLWTCNGCSQTNSDAQIQELLAPLHNQLGDGSMESKFNSRDMETVTEIEALIAKYSGNILHPNHYLLFTVENNFATTMTSMINLGEHSRINLSTQEIQYLKQNLIANSRKLLKICDKFLPGQNNTRGEKLYMLWHGMHNDDKDFQLIKKLRSGPLQKRRVIPNSIKEQMAEQMAAAKDAVQILSLEPDEVMSEGRIKGMKGWIEVFQPYF